jgi:hypothetical protein
MQSPSEETAQAALLLWGELSPELYRLFVPARHAKKWPKSTRQPKFRQPLEISLTPAKSQKS